MFFDYFITITNSLYNILINNTHALSLWLSLSLTTEKIT
jgi:hypothetical protein